ncbi:unnamed protein product [Camellia sinensis]
MKGNPVYVPCHDLLPEVECVGCSIDDVVGGLPRIELDTSTHNLPHNDPLVISLKVGDHPVNKILVDTGSSVNVMYNNLFKMLELKLEDLKPTSYVMRGFNGVLVEPMGEVTLPIYVDPVTVQTLFLVVNVSSRYNAIIGRRWLHEMRALDTGIAAIRGDQRATKECCMIEVKAKEKAKKIVAASSITDGCMRSDSGPMAVFNFAKFSEEAETDAKIGGDDSSVAAVEKVGASYRYTDDMELNDAVHTAILTLKEGFEGHISEKNIEIGIIGTDKKFRVLTPSEIADYLEEVE